MFVISVSQNKRVPSHKDSVSERRVEEPLAQHVATQSITYSCEQTCQLLSSCRNECLCLGNPLGGGSSVFSKLTSKNRCAIHTFRAACSRETHLLNSLVSYEFLCKTDQSCGGNVLPQQGGCGEMRRRLTWHQSTKESEVCRERNETYLSKKCQFS